MKQLLRGGSPPKIARIALAGLLIALLCSTGLFAQNTPIRGTITASIDNQPLVGASVAVKGEKIGTITDAKGEFSLSVPPNAVLEISSIGFVTETVNVGNQTVINVTLVEDMKSLGEVVVTALGIKKESKKLGYATSNVTAEQITENRTPNFINSVQGKVAGVNISGLGTGPAGTSKIRIRGQSSMSGQNGALIVVNGVPIDNTNFGYNPGNAGSDNSIQNRGGGNTADGGDGLSSINPDDIESMTILKGATAAALYGSRARDGVIMITTKTKSDSKGIGVSYNMNFTNETPLDFTDYQYEYGQGENGVRPTTPNPTSGQWSFGEKFQPGMTQVLFDNVTVPYVPVRNRIRNFFRDGQNLTNTVSLSSTSDKGGINLSIADMNSKGIVPNNSFNRKTINLGFSYNLSSKLSFMGSVNYSNEYNRNPPNIANQDNSIPTSLYNLANSMPLDLLEAKKFDANGNEFVYSRFRNRTNPYFTLSEQFQNIRRDRLFGNISAKYNILPWLYIQGRLGQDYWSRDQDYNNFPTGQASLAAAPVGFVNGSYTQESRRFREINADFLIGATRTFGNFGIDMSFGGNQRYVRSDVNSVFVQDFVVRGLYTVMNGRVKDPTYGLSEFKVNSLYGAGEFSFKNMMFLNLTARNDWFSVLSSNDRSILYPSVSLSWVFSDAFSNLPTWVNFAKLRTAYAEVGSGDVGPYSNNLFYTVNANLLANPSGTLQPVASISGTQLPNAALRPSRTSEKEIGMEVKLFNSRVNFDFTLYQKQTFDQIVSAQVSDASGFTNTLINSGQSRSNGIEMLLNLVPVKSSEFKWDITLNASYNKTKVLKILTDKPGERITTGTHVFNGELRQVVGQELGQIYGFGYKRDEQGRMIFGGNGIPLRTADLISFGSALPKWFGGITNSFNYKNISLSFLIDFKLGNKMLSGTNFNLVRHGLHKMTLPGRDSGGIVGVGVNEKGETNTVKANPQDYWSVVRSLAIIEPVVYNAGYWKLRQITVGYDVTRFIPAKWPLKSVKVNLVANNVFMLKKWIDNIDPETFGYSSDNVAGLESTGLPSTRSLGFNLNVKF